ncbi:BTAD domain-containing putative transcriptional regulator [Microtetraspora malaysiensis]|uniref:BTAD domain-containing putative transcriptional regulator n=1 Tax=Microtetraspora malaysiensis TaxID=161358 RepID=A0ABW6SP48_9ACTN
MNRSGERIALGGLRLRALLAGLALEPGKLLTQERLADILWGEEQPANTANALQTLVKRLRAAMGLPGVIMARSGGYLVDVDPAEVDAHRFARLAERGHAERAPEAAARAFDDALALWRGPALADLHAVPYLANAAALLEERRLAVIEARAEAYLALGWRIDLSAEAAEHPFRERLQGLAMRALAASGRQAEALALYENTRQALTEGLGVDPGPDLRDAHLAVLRGDSVRPSPPAADKASPPASPPASRSADPRRRQATARAPLTSFVGREEEVSHVGDLLRVSRLVTIIGPGGAGKTRLAVETALGITGSVAGGPKPHASAALDTLRMVELAPVTDPVDVPHAVLDALGVTADRSAAGEWRADPIDPVAQIVAAVGTRRLLLVLDNCEHVIDAVALIARRLVEECPGAIVLATSREPLRVPGEMLAPIPPLRLPPEGATVEEARDCPAVQLLLERSAGARPGFTLDESNVNSIVTICRRLDGMPLAIELAAARLRALTPAQLAMRLDDRFRLLTAGNRTALPRHQTLRAVVEWSWDLLDPREQELARRLAVFAGGATFDDIERVCGDEWPLSAIGSGADLDVLELLPSLVDKSLVEMVDDGRYRMLETIRAFALERLGEAGELDVFRRRHALRFLELVESAEPRLRTAGQIEWIDRLIADQDDLHAALRWALDRRDVELAVRLCGSLNWFWWLRGYRAEGAVWAEQVLTLAGEEPSPGLAGAYASCQFAVDVMKLGSLLADPDRLRTMAARMDVLIDRAVREGSLHPMLLIGRVVMAFMGGQEEHGLALLDGYVRSDDPWLASSAHMIRGGFQPERDRSRQDLEAAVAGFRAIGERWGLSEALLGLASLHAARGDLPPGLIEEVAELTSEWVSAEEVVSTLTRIASLRAQAGDLEGAAGDIARARAAVTPDLPAHALAQLRIGEGEVARRRGDLDGALRVYEQVIADLGRIPVIPQQEAWAHHAYARALAERGDFAVAREHHLLAIDALGAAPDLPVLASAVAGFAITLLRVGDAERAVVLFGAAVGIHPSAGADTDVVAATTAARSALGSRFDEVYARGATLSRQEIDQLLRST